MSSGIVYKLKRSDTDFIILPVNPEQLSVDSPYDFEDIKTVNGKEITLFKNRGLREFQFESFFPLDYNAAYCEYSDFLKPNSFVKKLEKWRTDKVPIKFTISDTSVDYPVTIRDFSYQVEKAGSPGDIYYSITLKEYNELKLVKVTRPNTKTKSVVTSSTVKSKDKITSYVVKKDDSLTLIARKVYRDGSRWREIYNANKKVIGKDPNLIFPGQKLVIP